jgi:hypothetical protein
MSENEEVKDPNELVQRRRLEQILERRKKIGDIATKLEVRDKKPEETKKVLAVAIRSYIRDLEGLRQHYPAYEDRWEEDELGTIEVGKTITEEKLRNYSSVETKYTEDKGPSYFNGCKMEVLRVEPEEVTLYGLNDFLSCSPEIGVKVKWRNGSDMYTQGHQFNRTIPLVLPHHVMDKAFRTANLYLSDIGLTATADMSTGNGLSV